ncbi:MAG: Asp23/Gls24 family envelope stress response protein [Lachnospiraceae bacterium]|nr:Asp23/Gls24 family envelope stress response protein [Lachnospiraceae bacterium]MDY5742319.1 Asp23/Gls24 family envelope stress response protein [Lachnospiraceae bacterium]
MEDKAKRKMHKIISKPETGEVYISEDVAAIIAALAATEVEGVESMHGNVTNHLIHKLGVKNLSSGVKIQIVGQEVFCELRLNVAYGVSIPDVSAKVQARVKAAVENMTGMQVVQVNIRIANVSMPS